MRVGLVLDRFNRRLGGVEQWTAGLADHLLARGYEVHVAARSIAAHERRPGLVAHELPPRPSRVALADAAAELLRPLRLDVIHDMGLGWYYDLLQPHGGARLAAHQQNLALAPAWSRSAKSAAQRLLPRYRDFNSLCEKQYAPLDTDRPARLVVAISEMVRSDLIAHHGVDRSRLRLVYNGVDAERFTPALREVHRRKVRRSLNILGNEAMYLIVAHNLLLKGLPALVRAAARLRKMGQPGVIVVVGGKRLPRWQRQAAQAGIADRIRFVGAVDDPTPYYAAADVYVQPTWYDPCSLVLLEALACGLPVITTRFNGAGELIDPGVHGTILDDPSDDLSLARAMSEWSNPGRRSMAARLARERMLAHTFERNMEEILELYQEVIATRRSRERGAA